MYIITETKRSDLPDDVFGIPEERKYPLETKEHVYSAVKLFNHVDKKYEKELAENIIKKMDEYRIDDIHPGPNNRFSKYYKSPVEEKISYTKNVRTRLVRGTGYLGYETDKKVSTPSQTYDEVYAHNPAIYKNDEMLKIIESEDVVEAYKAYAEMQIDKIFNFAENSPKSYYYENEDLDDRTYLYADKIIYDELKLLLDEGWTKSDITEYFVERWFSTTDDPNKLKTTLKLRYNWNKKVTDLLKRMLHDNYILLGYSDQEANKMIHDIESGGLSKSKVVTDIIEKLSSNKSEFIHGNIIDLTELGGGKIYMSEDMLNNSRNFDFRYDFISLALRYDIVIAMHGGYDPKDSTNMDEHILDERSYNDSTTFKYNGEILALKKESILGTTLDFCKVFRNNIGEQYLVDDYLILPDDRSKRFFKLYKEKNISLTEVIDRLSLLEFMGSKYKWDYYDKDSYICPDKSDDKYVEFEQLSKDYYNLCNSNDQIKQLYGSSEEMIGSINYFDEYKNLMDFLLNIKIRLMRNFNYDKFINEKYGKDGIAGSIDYKNNPSRSNINNDINFVKTNYKWTSQPVNIGDSEFSDVVLIIRQAIKENPKAKTIFVTACNPGHFDLPPDLKKNKKIIIKFNQNMGTNDTFFDNYNANLESIDYTYSDESFDQILEQTELELKQFALENDVDYDDNEALLEAMNSAEFSDYVMEGVLSSIWKGVVTLAKSILKAIIGLFKAVINFFKMIFNAIRNLLRALVGKPPIQKNISYIAMEGVDVKEFSPKNNAEIESRLKKSCENMGKELQKLSKLQTKLTKEMQQDVERKAKEDTRAMRESGIDPYFDGKEWKVLTENQVSVEEDFNTRGNKPLVYFTKEITPESLVNIYKALGVELQDKVAVKISTGEPGGHNYLQPSLIKDLVQSIDGTIVECNTAYHGKRDDADSHMKVAKDHGFLDIAPFALMDQNGEFEIPVENGYHLSNDLVGVGLQGFNSILVLSHFKGHQMAGFGGALKNVAIGIASSAGKVRIHTAGKGKCFADCEYTKQEEFLESMVDANSAVQNYMGKENMVYINVANNISIDCDCSDHPAEPELSDIGIFASLCPVAVDQACIDAVYNSKEDGKKSLIERIEKQKGLHILEAAERIGLGSRAYELVNIDNYVISTESEDESHLIKNYKPGSQYDLNDFQKIDVTDMAKIKRTIKPNSQLGDFEETFPKYQFGYFYADGNKPVGYIKISTYGHYICPIYLYPDYRGHGLSNQMMDVAVNELGAKQLWCFKDNEIAVKLYNSYGFKPTRRSNDEVYHMTLENIVTESKKTYHLYGEEDIRKNAEEFAKSKNPNIKRLGVESLKALDSYNNINSVLGAISAVLMIEVYVNPMMMLTIISLLAKIVSTVPIAIVNSALKAQIRFLKSRLKSNDTVKTYYTAVNILLHNDTVEDITLESLLPIMEAPTKITAEDGDEKPANYDDEVDTQDDGDDNTPDDVTPNDYDNEDISDDPDAEDNTADDETNAEDDTTDDDTDPEAGDDTGEEPNNYDDALDDDTGEDTTDDTTDDTTTEDDMTDENGDDTNNLENSNIKNYNLMIDFQQLYKSIEDILQHLKTVSYQRSIQKSILYRCLDNIEKVKDELIKFLEFSFSSDYKVNLYYYNIYVQSMKINLEMLRKIKDLDVDTKQ